MSELYFKDDNGNLVPDRRSTTNMEMQQAVLKLLAKVEAMETNIETKLEAVKDKVGNIDEKLTNRVQDLEKKINTHCEDEDEINDLLNEHDRAIDSAKTYIDRIHSLENKYKKLEERVEVVELAATKSKAKFVDSFLIILRNVFFTAIATGLIGFLGYLLISYIKGG